MTASTVAGPVEFRRAVTRLDTAHTRQEIEIGSLPAPARLAPFSHAVSVTLYAGSREDETASGRMILLYDPDGVQTWGGTLRVVVFATCELDIEIAQDPLLPEVTWSWLTEALETNEAGYSALGGTVTATSSTRFGDIAGPGRTDDVELRASWTADEHTDRHLQAFADFLAAAAGLPPEGVTVIQPAESPDVRSIER